MGSFIRWYCKQIGKSKLVNADLEGPSYKLVRPFHKNNISLQFHMEECHMLLTDQIDLVNPEGDKERRNALSISKLKAANYPDFGLEELVTSLWIESERIVRVICEVFVDLKLAIRQDLGFIPSGNVVLSSTYVGKILGADQLLVILCYRYQESGIGYWILSMTISGSGYYSLGVSSIVDAFVRSEFGVSSWHGARVGVRTYLLDGAIDGGEANGIIRDPKMEFRMKLVQGAMPICEGSYRLTSLERQELLEGLQKQQGKEGLNRRQSPWMKLFSEYGFEAKYHLGKANVDVVPWSRKKE
ncbi:hypothetical protein Tco_0926862 [Tanacetum coccineum]|uniref:Uncharacterized protein n=1 Tax=Tanacetum coccineum TaxID=301880 RepID=A0ABQ5DBU6_9ASTR